MSTPDFYVDDHALAAYFEKDWFDHVVTSGTARPQRFAFAPFDLATLYSPYHERLARLIEPRVTADTRRLLEVGSSLGRTFYEVCRGIKSLESATLVEPSQKFVGLFDRIFADTDRAYEYFPVLKGNGDLTEVQMRTAGIREACAHVRRSVIARPFQDVPTDLGTFDLVVCSNVIDQCHDPLDLVNLLDRSTAPGGVLALSSTYQWQSKYRGLPTEPIRHLDRLFGEAWTPLDEANVPFQVRINERHWMTFLSHVVLFRKD